MTLAAPLLPLLLLLLLGHSAAALENGLARTPPMGWLAWERFTCTTDCAEHPNDCINDHLFMAMAERLASDGWLQLGYEYLHIDDCWNELHRDPNSQRLLPDRKRFGSGITAVAEFAHSKGLKLGIYGDCGLKTCAGYPAQLRPNSSDHATDNYFQLDAATFADWQVDALKFDGCHIDPLRAQSVCPGMARALEATGRPTLLICEWPFYMMYTHVEPDWALAAASCNLWRYYDDIEDSWASILNTIDYTVRHQRTIVKYHGPGHWFDPDQLVIGNFGLSLSQAEAQMALWCIWAAPLLMSNDLRALEPAFARILKNKQLIQVDQDKLGVFGLMVRESADGQQQAFVKPVEPVDASGCPSFAVVYLNRDTLGNRVKVSFSLAELLLGAPLLEAQAAQLRVDPDARRKLEAAKCRELLLGLTPLKATGRDSRPPKWTAFDMINERVEGHMQPDQRLELLVAPSSVRAVMLTRAK